MKNKYKYLFFLTVVVLFVIYYKVKQKEFLGLSTPKIENENSIVNYAKSNGIIGEIFITKNKKSYPIMKKYFDYGYLYVLDKDFNLLDCNIESYGGRCFQDIQKDICNKIKIKPRKFNNKINGKLIMNTLLNNSKCITSNKQINFSKYEVIYLYTWVKYSKSCINKSSISFIKCSIENSKNKSLIITINTDLLN